MDFKRDLEEYKRNCVMHIEEEQEDDSDKAIIIHDLDLCKVDHISVKDLQQDDEEEKGDTPTVINMLEEKVHRKQKSLSLPSKNVSRISQVFSKEEDIPNLTVPVYDFVMSKNKTLPQQRKLKLSQKVVLERLKRKWICIGSLTASTLIVIVVMVVVLFWTSDK